MKLPMWLYGTAPGNTNGRLAGCVMHNAAVVESCVGQLTILLSSKPGYHEATDTPVTNPAVAVARTG